MSDTICQGCDKKSKWLVGNITLHKWLCEVCDEAVETTGKLPEVKKKKK